MGEPSPRGAHKDDFHPLKLYIPDTQQNLSPHSDLLKSQNIFPEDKTKDLSVSTKHDSASREINAN